MDKEKERRHIDSFKSIYSAFPPGPICSNESPDFLIQSDGSIIGIEHTQIFKDPESHGSSLQAQERIRLDLIESTKSLYENFGGPSINAYFIFNHDEVITRNQISSLTEYFTEKISSHIDSSYELKEISFVDHFPQDQNAVHFILVERRPIVGESNFSHASMGWTKEIDSTRIISEIGKKEDRIEIYKEDCSEIWLLIVAEDFTNATSISLSSEAITHNYETCFDKVFLYWHFQPHYFELSTTNNNCS